MFKRLLLLAILCQISCIADGFYKTANATLPSITGQRAIIKHKDGIQTMIIESALESEAQELGWIVPLPSVPTEVKKVEPTVFRQFNRELQVKLIARDKESNLIGFIALFPLLILLYYCSTKERSKLGLILGCSITFFVIAVSFPSLAATRGINSTGITELSSEIIGNYEIKVIKAKTATDLSNWSKAVGLTEFSSEESKIIDDYIGKGWCFVSTKLQRKETGKSAPHPLSFTFPTDQPMYPMALTALPGGRPYFEFFVISDKTITHPQLRTLVSRTYQKKKIFRVHPFEEFNQVSKERKTLGLTTFGAKGLFWDGMVISRLGAKIDAGDMEDIIFEKKEFVPTESTLYSKRVAKSISLFLACNVLSTGLFFLIILSLFYKNKEKVKRFTTKSFLILMTISCLVFVVKYYTLDITEVDDKDIILKPGGRHASSTSRMVQAHFNCFLAENPTGTTEEKFHDYLEKNNEYNEDFSSYYRIAKLGNDFWICIEEINYDGADNYYYWKFEQPNSVIKNTPDVRK